MKNVLIVSWHTDLPHNSAATNIITEDVQRLLPQASYDYLERSHPAPHIAVAPEPTKLAAADEIVPQFPPFVYSMPTLVATWM